MKVHQQFDLDVSALKKAAKESSAVSQKIEELLFSLSKKGYTVLKSSSYVMGIPQSITIIKEATGSIASAITSSIKEDFDSVSERSGMQKVFN